ncbi:tyrosine-type recombinase/integrase [Providencia rettgeri]
MKRKHLTREEVELILNIISKDMISIRDYCMVSMAFIHGLRVSELISLKLDDYIPSSQQIYINRLKKGFSTIHPILAEENKILQCWIEERKNLLGNDLPWLFLSKQGKPLTRQRFYQIIRYYGELANLSFPVYPHMLRHACGYNLAEHGNDTRLIQDYLGHRNIAHTVLYTAANAARFINVFEKRKEYSIGNILSEDKIIIST